MLCSSYCKDVQVLNIGSHNMVRVRVCRASDVGAVLVTNLRATSNLYNKSISVGEVSVLMSDRTGYIRAIIPSK